MLLISVENSAGVQQGDGPITSASGWVQNPALNRLGSFSFQMPASDPRAALLVQRAVVRARIGPREIGAGIVDKVEVNVRGDVPMLSVSGCDLGQELTWRTVDQLALVETGYARAVWCQMVWIHYTAGTTNAPVVDASAACDGSAGTYYQYNTPGAQDYRPWLYIGAAKPFNFLNFTISNGVQWANNEYGNWQYFNGVGWVTLGIASDATRNANGVSLMQSGLVSWNMHSDMAQTTENGYTGYYIRVEAGMATQRRVVEVSTYPSDAPTDTALALIAAKFPAGWSLDTTLGLAATVKTDVYGYLTDENCVEALIKLAEMTGESWRIGVGRTVVWLGATTPSSGLRAVAGGDAVALEGNTAIVRIKDLKRTTDSYAKATRVYPRGAGLGDGALTLAHCTRTAAAGYTLNKTSNYLAHTANDAAGRVDVSRGWKDIGPKTTDATAREAASNALYDAALVWLARNLADAVSYDVELVGESANILPGQTIRVVYHRWVAAYHAVSVDADLIVLGVSRTLGSDELLTTGLTVSSVPIWPMSDTALLARLVQQSVVLGRYPQPVEMRQINSATIRGSGLPATIGGGGLNSYVKGVGG